MVRTVSYRIDRDPGGCVFLQTAVLLIRLVATHRILSVLLIFALSPLIIRVGSIALRMTGLSPEVSSFQSMSAFTGTGFTTDEAEEVTSTPGRRTVVQTLIRLGSIGLVGALATLTLSFTRSDTNDAFTLAYILGGTGVILLADRDEGDVDAHEDAVEEHEEVLQEQAQRIDQ